MTNIPPIEEATATQAPIEGNTNRGYDIRITAKDGQMTKITLETINDILMGYFKNVIKPSIDENNALRVVPVLYGDAERWAMFRREGYIRDNDNGKLFAPLIMIRRTSIEKGQIQNPNNKYMHRVLDEGYNARNVYDRFMVQNRITPSKKMRTVIIPDYMDLTYECVLWTELQEQMDHLIEQINVENQEYWGQRNNFKFRVNIDSFETTNVLPVDADRLVRTNFSMTIGAYLIPESMVDNFKVASTSKTFFTPKKVIITENIVNSIKKDSL